MGLRTLEVSKTVTNVTPPARRDPASCGAVRLWSYPKIVFFYPTFLAAVAAGLLTQYRGEDAEVWAWIFMVVFGVNLLVVSFDFPRTTALTYFFASVALVLAAVLVNVFVWEFFPPLADLMGGLHPEANAQFYWLIGGGLGAVYGVIILANRRFDYYTVESLRIIHHHGVLDSRDQYPALGSTIQKDITDVFEYLLLRSGRLVIQPERGPAIVLENVPRIDTKVAQLETLLNELPVEVRGPEHRHVPRPSAAP